VSKNLSIDVSGQPIGRLERPWLPRMLRFRGPDFTLYDARDSEIGWINRRKSIPSWTVIEVVPEVTLMLRSLLFGVEAVVNAPRTAVAGPGP
jgi:hypothetical protein